MEQNLGILVKEKLDMSHQGALASQEAKHMLDCIKRRVASRLSEMIYSGLMRTYLENCVQLCGHQYKIM